MIELPTKFPAEDGLLEALKLRRSTREFKAKPIPIDHLAYLLWACYGRLDLFKGGRKGIAVPSAGATYPLEIYLVSGENGIEAFEAGLYRYNSIKHSLEKLLLGDLRKSLAKACLSQDFIEDAPLTIVVAADYRRTTRYYGERGYRYVYMEAGHVGQNIYLVCASLGLGTVAVGAFRDAEVADVLGLPGDLEPIYIFPVGFAS